MPRKYSPDGAHPAKKGSPSPALPVTTAATVSTLGAGPWGRPANDADAQGNVVLAILERAESMSSLSGPVKGGRTALYTVTTDG